MAVADLHSIAQLTTILIRSNPSPARHVMFPKIDDIPFPFPAAFELFRQDHHTCKRRRKHASWELWRAQQTSSILEEITVQDHHHHHLAEFSRCSRSSGVPYFNHRMTEVFSYIPMYTQPSPPPLGRKRALLVSVTARFCKTDDISETVYV
jgi:hypothetical protein